MAELDTEWTTTLCCASEQSDGTQFGKIWDTLLANYPSLYNVPYVMEELRKIGRTCAMIADEYSPELIPFQGLLGLSGHQLTTAKSIPTVDDIILHYLKDPKPWELWHIPYYGSCRICIINRRGSCHRVPEA